MDVLKFVLISASLVTGSWGHIPATYYDWGEPSQPLHVGGLTGVEHSGPAAVLTRAESAAKLAALRTILTQRNIDAYIVPTADAHNSQYIAESDARREWLSGLSGSSGTAVVTGGAARVWTDGRYYTQFYLQVDTELWALMTADDLSIAQWLVANLTPDSVVGLDPTTYTRTAWSTLESTLSAANITLQATPTNLVDLARAAVGDPAPARPANPLLALSSEYTGRIASDKIGNLMQQVTDRGVSALVLTSLDDIAYTLNLRGSDIPYNPVFFSYLILRPNGIVLFWNAGDLTEDIHRHLTDEGVTLETRAYDEFFEYLTNMTNQLTYGSTVWLSRDASHAVFLAAESNGRISTLSTVSPVALMKCIKNEVELAGFRSSHVKDGVAVVRALRWVHAAVAAGQNVTEMDLSDMLETYRSEERHFMGPSFATIAGAGENGAVIHYKPSREGEQRVIRSDDMLLVDSGGQYLDGTTDITRTRHLGTPTDMQRLAFTRVLQGQILMGTAVFPQGSTGNVIESFARKALWDVGLNYAHGTGHGVGHYLNVHEGPSGIGAALSATDPGITPAMIFSNEPGFYEVGQYGIRHEDLVEVIQITRDADHILASGMVGDFEGRGAVGFYTISLAPHQTSSLDVGLLNDFEIKYLNDYHARVLATLGPILLERGLTEDYDWLAAECAPIRSAAILAHATPLLIVFGLFSLWF